MSQFFKKSLYILTIVCIGLNLQSNAQGNNPISKISIASPTAASLAKYGDIPVSFHTGLPQISIPIYTVSDGALSLPISLSYHASGLKVQEPASWVGAGWSLNAGGVITRSVVGAPDERGTNNGGIETHGHFSDYGYNNYLNNYTGTEDWQGFASGWKDGEPDLYFFNFGNYSGKFYFRDDRTPVVVPEADFKIEPNYSGTNNTSIQSFIITTPDGVKYYFGNSPGLTGTAPVEITKIVTDGNGLSTANTISSWYLNKIATADDLFAITLTYQAENYGYHTISMFQIEGNATPTTGSTFGSTHGYDLVKNIIQGVRLSQISLKNSTGVVNFVEAATPRTDLSDNTPSLNIDVVNQSSKPLGSIQISDGTNVLKKFNFSYSYFTDNSTPLVTDIENFAPDLQTDKQRLKLDQVQEISGDGSTTKPPHSFTYINEQQVPRRLSFGIDHWGFYNGVTNNTTLIPTYTKFSSSATTVYPGADRDAHWPAMSCGTLQQINYPTGGFSLFEFEPNSVYNTTSSIVNVTLANLTVHLFSQNTFAVTSPFVTDGSAMNISFNNSSIFSANFSITNSSNVIVYSTIIGNGQVSPTNPLTLPQGTYTASLSLPNGNYTGGAQAIITQYQTVQSSNTITIGGNRIKTITNNDGVTPNNNVVNSYAYTGDNGLTSGILYSRPAYVGIVRNDLIQYMGYWTVNGFTPYMSQNGCPAVGDATYYKSSGSIRPMATTQGNHIGYSQVKVFQTGNGYSIYKYYGTTGAPSWQGNNGDIAVRTVNTAGCDANAPNFPPAPLPFDFMRGELKYEAHYNEAGQLLKEKTYVPVYVQNPVKTPAFIATYYGQNSMGQGGIGGGNGSQILATKYELTTARKTELQVIETIYSPGAGSLTTTNTSYYESPFHHEITRSTTTNSKSETLETKSKYAFDFRISTCDGIDDGYTPYTNDCNSCLIAYNNDLLTCGNNNSQCLTNAYLNYQQCKRMARVNYVTYRRTNFTDPLNTFQTYHDNAKALADAELKPILQLQDNFENHILETTSWKSNNLLNAIFSRYDYSTVPAGKVYLNKVQSVKLSSPSGSFIAAATAANNSGIIKDNRYMDETLVKFYNGNLAEITEKDGITTSYLWGYNNPLPIVKAIGANQSTLLNAYNAVGGNLSLIRNQPSLSGAFLNTYTYQTFVGMTSETDANGNTLYYEYDSLKRLKTIRDKDGNILKTYDYKYQQ